jgi:Skp family chaperone for outer membrane proteins
VKRTIIAITTVAALFGTFVCLPKVRGQNGTAPARAPNSSPRSTTQSSAGQSSQPLKIACIDFGMILKDYKKVADKRRKLNGIAEAGNAKIRQLQGEGQALAKPLQEGHVDQESDEFAARTKKLFHLENSIKACKAQADRDMKMESVKISAAVYQDMQAALKLFSEQNGYTLVLQIDREAAAADDYRLIQKIAGQQIFYYRSHDDITVAVLSHLNQEYEAERAKAGTDDPAAPASSVDEPTRSIPASPNRKRATR